MLWPITFPCLVPCCPSFFVCIHFAACVSLATQVLLHEGVVPLRDVYENLPERLVLVGTLHMKLRVRMQPPGRFLCLDRSDTAVDATEDASFWRRTATEEILAGFHFGIVAVVAVGTGCTDSQAEEMLVRQVAECTKTIDACQRISGQHCSPIIISWKPRDEILYWNV